MKALGFFVLTLAACGTTPTAPNPASFGTISMTLSDAIEGGSAGTGNPDVLAASLFPTATVAPKSCGDTCCYVPPAAPSTDGGFAGTSADGGPDFVMLNVGAITLFDVTAGAPLGSLSYMRLAVGAGYAMGYPAQDLGPNAVPVGDLLRVSVPAGPLGQAFDIEARAVAKPDVAAVATVTRTSPLALSWTPDPNASTMTVSLSSNHGAVVCTLADSTATVSVPPSVMAAFQSGDTCYVELTRTATIAANVTGGSVAFESRAMSSFTAAVQ